MPAVRPPARPASGRTRRWVVILVGCVLASLLIVGAASVLSLRSAHGTTGALRSGGARAAATSTPPLLPPPTSGSPVGPIRVVGLGDSVTAGANCDCDDYVTGFGRLLAQQQHRRVHTSNDGASGSTSPDLLNDLRQDQSLRSQVRQADVVVITTGANDLYPALRAWRSGSCDSDCYTPDVEAMRDELSQVLQLVTTLAGDQAGVLVTGYWNVFTDGDVAKSAEKSGYLDWSDRVTRDANAAITADTRRYGATYVDLYTPFKGDGERDPTGLLADDGDHPDSAGTALISRAVLAAYDRR